MIADPDPNKRHKIFAWKLTETHDPFGNRILYEYLRDWGEDGPHPFDQLYLQRILYADYAADQEAKFLVSVTFHYEDRPDYFSDYRAGFEIRTRKRCTHIDIHTDASKSRLVRTYHFTYLDQRVNGGELSENLLPPNGVSLLSQIKIAGHDEEQSDAAKRTQELPPLEFGFTQFEPEKRDFLPLGGTDLPSQSLSNPDLELVDLFGNGMPDILQTNGGSVRYWRNRGGGQFDLPRPMTTAPAALRLSDPGVQLIDADGDGRTDLLVTTQELSGYFPLRFGGLWDGRSFRRYRQAPSFDLKDPEVRLVDLDGDGVTDAIRSGTRLECFFNDPKEGWNGTRHVERQALEAFPNVNFSDERVRWADMSGDGLQDILLVYDGNIEYWPNLGHGNWGRRISMRNCPRFPYSYDPKHILIGDVDGDGLADLVYVDHCKVILWINQSGNGWSDPIEIDGTPAVANGDEVRLADVLGTGVSGVLWSKDTNGLSREHLFFLDFTGGVKPYLLNEMNNHMGAVTRVEYAPSTNFYLEDEKDPKTRWKTPLPFPVQTVARVEVIDELSGGKLTTEYCYHHGYWDGAEREFRGFGRVDQRDTEVFEHYHEAGLHAKKPFVSVDQAMFSPPTETRTWFHLGPVGDEFGEWEEVDFSHEFWPGDTNVLTRPPETESLLKKLPRRLKRDALRALRGSILRTELYARDGSERQDRPYTVTESQYGMCAVVDGVGSTVLVCDEAKLPEDWLLDGGQRPVFFPQLRAQRTTQWERGDDPMTQFAFTDEYDQYGRSHRQTTIACPRWWQGPADLPMEQYLATQARSVFAEPTSPDTYLHDRVAKTTTYEFKNSGGQTVFDLKHTPDDSPSLTIIGQTINYYDGDAFVGLPFGQINRFGALVRSESLVLTEETLWEAYRSGATALDPAEMPPYLVPDAASAWPDEYPLAFRDRTAPHAGYIFYPGDAQHQRGYWATTTRNEYDFQAIGAQGRGLLITTIDPLGTVTPLTHETRIEYDPYQLLPIKVTDAVGLSTEARYDYRVVQPNQVTDPNGNRTPFGFTPLGLLEWTAVMGKENEQKGDTPEAPGMRLEYDFLAFVGSDPWNRQPISVRTIRRVHHVNDEDVPLPERNATIEMIEYSDGFGRLLQTRTLAEDVTFGDPAFGAGVLPADQADKAGTKKDVVGKVRGENEPPNVVVSGWQTYNNKGWVVENYEPFFQTGWDYFSRAEAQQLVDDGEPNLFGQKATMYYDPRGQVIRTTNPDGSQARVVFGIPDNLDDPETFQPTSWESFTYDANDNAGRTHEAASSDYRHHWNTPTSSVIDALGRTVATVERNRAAPDPDNPTVPLPPVEEYRTRFEYDIRGNLLYVTDALGRVAFQHVYDLAYRQLRVENIDAGVRRVVLDAASNEIERRDSKGAVTLRAYDELNRHIRLWSRDNAFEQVTLREHLIYGDSTELGLSDETKRSANLLGKLHHHYDEAGRLTLESYDFKGNVLEKVREVIGDKQILSVFDSPPPDWQVKPFRVDWQPIGSASLESHAAGLLDPFAYRTSMRFDALNRITSMRYPQDVEGHRRELNPQYNRAGALEGVSLDAKPYVEHIAYNAKGQRTLIAYSNGILTRYAYDPLTFRLARLRSERYAQPLPGEFTYHFVATSNPLQDFAYSYDLTGNILRIVDRTPGSGVHDNPQAAGIADPQLAALVIVGDALTRQFDYDPLYRLLSATGRECNDIPAPRPWSDHPRCGFNSGQHGTPNPDNGPQMSTVYRERYSYDPVGNMTTMHHYGSGSAWTRHFGMGGLTPQQWAQEWSHHVAPDTWPWAHPPGNCLTHVGDNDAHTKQTHFFDANGSLIQENTERHFEWDQSDRMRVFRTQAGGSQPSLHAHYLYDADGQRVKKLVRKQGGRIEVTVYVNGVFEYHRLIEASATQENNTLHVMDNRSRIALVRVGDSFPEDSSPAVKFQLGDHLGSSSVVIDDTGAWINREECTPYGETSFGSFARKRYRFTGKERNEENGLYYHGARHYAPWLGRWTAADPIGLGRDGPGIYNYKRGNPVTLSDPNGMQSNEPLESSAPALVEPIASEDPGQSELPALYTWSEELREETEREQAEADAKLLEPKTKRTPAPFGYSEHYSRAPDVPYCPTSACHQPGRLTGGEGDWASSGALGWTHPGNIVTAAGSAIFGGNVASAPTSAEDAADDPRSPSEGEKLWESAEFFAVSKLPKLLPKGGLNSISLVVATEDEALWTAATQSIRKRGPAGAGVLHPRTGRFFFEQNLLDSAGRSVPGAHAEVRALNEARHAVGFDVPLHEFLVYPIRLRGAAQGQFFPLRGDCANLIRGTVVVK